MIPKNVHYACCALASMMCLLFFTPTYSMKKSMSYSDVEMALIHSSRIDADFDEVPNLLSDPEPTLPTLAKLDQELQQCCRYTNYSSCVSELIESYDVLAQDRHCKTRLHYAVYMWNYDLIAKLLSFKAEKPLANIPDIAGETPLHALVMRDPLSADEAEKTLYLVGFAQLHGARLDLANNDGETLLHYAVRYQTCNDQCTAVRKRLIEALVTRGIDVNQPTTLTGQTPLHYALKNYHNNTSLLASYRMTMIPTLLALGADPSQADTQDRNTALHFIASNNNLDTCLPVVETVGILLNNPNLSVVSANPNTPNFLGYTPLHLLTHLTPTDIRQAVAKQLLHYWASPNVLSRDGYAPLHIAVCNQSVEWVELLSQHPSTNCCILRAPWPPFKAITGDIEIATPLDMAYEILDYDFDHIDSDASSEQSSEDDPVATLSQDVKDQRPNPLLKIIDILELKTIEYINKQLVKSAQGSTFWLKVGIFETMPEVDAQDTEGNTRLHYAVQLLDTELIHVILNSATETSLVDTTNKLGETPLLCLLKQKHVNDKDTFALMSKVAAQLIEDGASTDAANNEGETPLHYLVKYAGYNKYSQYHSQLFKTIIETGAALDASTVYGETPLHYVFKFSCLSRCPETNESMLTILLSNQANPNPVTHEDETPLHYAVMYGIFEPLLSAKKVAIELLVASGAKVNAATKMGVTPLGSIFKTCCYAGSNGLTSVESRLPFVKTLLELGADPNTQDALGNTPLHCLMSMRYSDNLHLIARQLIKAYKAQTTLVNKAGHTPLHIATATEQPRWVELLLEDPAVNAIEGYASKLGRAPRSAASNKSALDLALELCQLRMHPTFKNGITLTKLEKIDRMNQGSLTRVTDLLKKSTLQKYSEESICKQMLFLVLLSSRSVSL